MASSIDTKRSSPNFEPLELGPGLPTTAADVAAQRDLHRHPVAGLLTRMNDLSAIRLGLASEQRRTVSAGRVPFEI
jgi:hypothetical protein